MAEDSERTWEKIPVWEFQWERQNLFRKKNEPGILELWESCRP